MAKLMMATIRIRETPTRPAAVAGVRLVSLVASSAAEPKGVHGYTAHEASGHDDELDQRPRRRRRDE